MRRPHLTTRIIDIYSNVNSGVKYCAFGSKEFFLRMTRGFLSAKKIVLLVHRNQDEGLTSSILTAFAKSS